jgi:hypothetical protein
MTFEEIKTLLENQGFAQLQNKNSEVKNYDCLCFTNGEWQAACGWQLDSEDKLKDLSVPTNAEGEFDKIISKAATEQQKIQDLIAWKIKHVNKLQE